MATWTALTHAAGQDAAEALQAHAEAVLNPEPFGSGVFEIEDGNDRWEVGLFFTEAPDEIALALLAAAHGANPFVVSELPDVDWVAHVRRELTPVEAGRFFVHGSHDADRIPEGAEALCIDAAMAFGTGHHGTTAGCLEMIDRLVRRERPQNALDLGTGSAVLAIALARLAHIPVLATDIDPIATAVAARNVQLNGVAACVETATAAGFQDPIFARRGPFELIVANILARPLMRLAPKMAAHCAPGGSLVLSGILAHQREQVLAAYVGQRFRHMRTLHREEWVTIHLKR